MRLIYQNGQKNNDILFSPGYQWGITKYLAVHHAGGLGSNEFADTSFLTSLNINDAHRTRFAMQSKYIPNGWGGYNLFIEKDGKIVQFKAIGEETAAQKGWNFNGICVSVCLAGNFVKQNQYTTTNFINTPTQAQVDSLIWLKERLPKIPIANVNPHRFYQSTRCYGDLPEDWARKLWVAQDAPRVENNELLAQLTLLHKLLLQYIKLLDILKPKRTGEVIMDCSQTDPRG